MSGTVFPGAIDTFVNPSPTDKTKTFHHALAHANEISAIEAIQTKVGLSTFLVSGTLSYMLLNTSSVDPGHKHSATTSFTGVQATARLGSGTASSSTWLNGDAAWAALVPANFGTGATATNFLFGDNTFQSLQGSWGFAYGQGTLTGTASSVLTVTHNLGRVPKLIHLYAFHKVTGASPNDKWTVESQSSYVPSTGVVSGYYYGNAQASGAGIFFIGQSGSIGGASGVQAIVLQEFSNYSGQWTISNATTTQFTLTQGATASFSGSNLFSWEVYG